MSTREVAQRAADASIVTARADPASVAPVSAGYAALVLDAGLRQSLATVRSLGRHGLQVAALESKRTVSTFASRWCARGFHAPSLAQRADVYLSCLEHILECTPVGVVVASSDAAVALLREHRARIERHAVVALARDPALGIAIHKERTLTVAASLGVKVPHGVAVGASGDLPAAVRAIGLPAVVKPVESWVRSNDRGVRLTSRLATTPDEARRAVEELISFGAKALFQQFLPGRCEAVSFLYACGKVYARFAQWAKRMEPPLGGTSVWRVSIAVPDDIGVQAERLVREIDLEGYSEVEFRRDGAGRPYLMEINPRLSASVEVAVRAGVDFPYLLYQWADGQQIDRVEGYRTGYWMRYLAGDIRTTVAAVLQRGRPGVLPPADAIRDFLASFLVPAGYDYVDWSDPLPACVAVAGFARHVVRRCGRAPARGDH